MKKLTENKHYQIGMTAFLVIAACILFYFLIAKIGLIMGILKAFIKILTPFILGFGFAYLLNPIIKFFKKNIFIKLFKNLKLNDKSKEKIANNLSILISIIITLGIIILLFSFIIPEVLKSIETIIINMPVYMEEIRLYLLKVLANYENLESLFLKNYTAINAYFIDLVNQNFLPRLNEWIAIFSNGFIGVIKVIFNIVLGFVIAIYYLIDKDHFKAQLKKLAYSLLPIKTVNNLMDNLRHTDRIFGNFIVGKLLDAATIGFITFLFLALFGYPYPLLIGVIIGLTNMIPYFGPYIGTIPSTLLILLDAPGKALIFILFIIALQQVDSYVIDPKLSGAKTGLKSFWVLFSILFFGSLFGIIGMILGVPIFALIYGFVNNKCNNRLKDKNLPTDTNNYEELERINSESHKFVK